MDAAVIALLVIVGVIVAAIAVNLIAIAATLRKITGTLVKVKGGVIAIKGQTDPVGDVIGGVAADVAAIDDDLEGLLELVADAQAAAAAEVAPAPSRSAPAPARRSAPAPVVVEDIVEFDDEKDGGFDAELEEELDDDGDLHRPSMAEAVARARAGV